MFRTLSALSSGDDMIITFNPSLITGCQIVFYYIFDPLLYVVLCLLFGS